MAHDPSLFQVLLIFACFQNYANGLSCYNCSGTRLPSECSQTTTCQVDETCAVQKNIHGTYNSGCIPAMNCSSLGHVLIGRRDLVSTDEQICLQCCNTDLCNNIGCGSIEEECKKHLAKGYFYDSVTDTCAKVVKSEYKFNHSEADRFCKQDGGALISVDGDNKQYFLLSWIYTHLLKDADFWIGLQKNTSDGYEFHWQDKRPVTFENWGITYNKQPSDKRTGTEDCVYLDANDNYLWHDGECDDLKAGFICEIWNITNKNDLGSYCRRKVFQGYLYDSTTGMCFKLKDAPVASYTHVAALSECASEPGATLAKVDSEQKTDLIRRWIYSNHANQTSFWIGLYDTVNASTFKWPDGSSTENYTHWGGPDQVAKIPTQPNRQDGDENCVYMSKSNDYKWFSEKCYEHKNGFICEYFPSSNETFPVGGCYNKLSQGYFYDVYTQLCVKVYTNGSWDRASAQAQCQQNGDSLLEINSKAKDTYVQYLIKSLGHHSKSDFWIGAEYQPKDKSYHWQRTPSSLGHTNWYQNLEKPKNCVVLDHTDRYRWAPKECGYKATGFICELDKAALSRLSG